MVFRDVDFKEYFNEMLAIEKKMEALTKEMKDEVGSSADHDLIEGIYHDETHHIAILTEIRDSFD